MRHLLHLLVILGFVAAAPAHAAETEEDSYVLVMVGDSLTAGFSLADEAALPARLQAALAARGLDHVEVVNAGVSGDTSASGLSRYAFSLPPETDGVVIALGANDALQGRPVEAMRANLDAMIAHSREQGHDIVLAGMRAPVNLGEVYRAEVDGAYAEIAEAQAVPLYPFLLAPVALEPDFLMADGMHPTAEGVERMAAPLAEFLAQALFAPGEEAAP
jgi:acyl-CoA thioesterase-1